MGRLTLWALAGGVLTGAAGDSGRFEFREPRARAYQLDLPETTAQSASPAADPEAAWRGKAWLRAHSVPGNAPLMLGSRVVIRLASPDLLPELLADSPLAPARRVADRLWILQAPDALTAAREAQKLAAQPGVTLCHPVRKRHVGLTGVFAPRPNDPYFDQTWHLENRDPRRGTALGDDLNVRAAWPVTRGAGVMVAVADNGFEITHPDLAANARNRYHFNFHTGVKDGRPMTSKQNHATAVAGLIAAVGENHLGSLGVAPEAQLASWVIFDSFDNFLDEETAMDMFHYGAETVAIQNHSWGNVGVQQLPLGELEDLGIKKAITEGRGGRGVIFVRAAGNDRAAFNDVNDDGYGQDPRVITVAAVRNNGRVTSYSTPGAPILVAAFSGDHNVDLSQSVSTNYPGLITTDRSGSLGYNRSTLGTQGDYAFGATSFSGTSAATPLISGICALILSANPRLTYRDVQQILILSARQLDPADPDLARNGAGLWVSHNVGFGVPDAAHAVRLALHWPLRPPLSTATAKSRATRVIPDDGLHVHLTGLRVPPDLELIPASPVDGLHPRGPTDNLPLVHVGQALSPIKEDLHGKAALIQRGGCYFVEKLRRVVEAGAEFAIIYNNQGGDQRFVPNGADINFMPLPAVFISQQAGEQLAEVLRLWRTVKARLETESAGYTLPVQETLQCEHVRLSVQAVHPRRGDLRIVLISPSGTRSVLQRLNNDTLSSLDEWDYYTVHDFYESSAGDWRVEFTDERTGVSGQIHRVELTIFGVPIKDRDHDGLDDDWERLHLGTRFEGPADDHDGDGASNLVELLQGTDPRRAERGSRVDLTRWDARVARLSWPGLEGVPYEVRLFDALGGPPVRVDEVPGHYPETTWYGPLGSGPRRFFSVTPK
jgi:subtilisin family serine protease/subtilisin-like proprotein convertase family protein